MRYTEMFDDSLYLTLKKNIKKKIWKPINIDLDL